MFKKKKQKEDERYEEIRKAEIDKVIREVTTSSDYRPPEEGGGFHSSREYEIFKSEQKTDIKLTIYEKMCRFSGKLFALSPDQKTKVKMQRAIELTHMRVTPENATSFAVQSSVLLFILFVLGALLGAYSFTTLLVLLVVDIIIFYTLLKYPESSAKSFRIRASSEIILAIIYMVIYMRSSPNLEGAVRFAAQNLTGPLAADFKQMLWEVETQQTKTMAIALNEYLDRWGEYSEFRESINLLISSMSQPDERRYVMLDESVAVILNSTKERMSHYSQSLRMPILVIHALGIMLPILVLIMFPIIILLLSESVNPIMLVMFYDVILPLLIYYLSRRTLDNRPVSFGAPDISMHPKYSPLGMVKPPGFKRYVKLWPIAFVVTIAMLAVSFALLVPVYFDITFNAMLISLMIPWSIGLGLIIYYFFDTYKKLEIRNQIRKMQDEFAEALFRLSGSLSLGTPFEKAIEDAVRKSPDLSISALFKKALKNVKQGGLSFEAAFFDKKFGAIWEYPSRLIMNVIRIVLEATKKGVRIAAISAMSISRYMKQLKSIDEDLKEMLSESTSAMKFLAFFLGPFIAGVTVTMAAVMMRIFEKLGEDLASLETGSVPGFSTFFVGGFGEVKKILPIAGFEIIVGIYVIQIIWLLTNLSVGVENGPDDKIARRYYTAWALLIGLVVYTLSILVTFQMFGSQLETLFAGG